MSSTDVAAKVAPSQKPVTIDVNSAAAAKVNAEFKSDNPNHTKSHGLVSLDELEIDPAVQRPENPAEVNAIARDFDEGALGVITVSVRVEDDGTEHKVVLDGQQRRAACLKVGYNRKLQATLHRGLTLTEEAKLFRRLNFRRSIPPLEQFRIAADSEGEPVAVAVRKMLQELNIPLGTQRGAFQAVKVALRLARRRGGAGIHDLRWAFEMIQKIYNPRENGSVYEGAVVEAFTLLRGRDGNRIDENNLVRKLAAEASGMPGLIGHGKTIRMTKGSGHMSAALIQAIINRYNARMFQGSRNRLADWEASDASED